MTSRVETGSRPSHYNTRYRLDLTPRQRQVLDMIERGSTNFEIAQALGLSLEGAKYHVSEILGKLDVASREEAASYWRHYNRPAARLERVLRGLMLMSPLRAGAIAAAVGGAAGLAIIVAVIAGSGGDGGAGAAPDATATPATSTAGAGTATQTRATVVPTSSSVAGGATPGGTPAPTAVCLQATDYREDGAIPVQAAVTGDSTAVSDIRFAPHEGCERVVIDLDGAVSGPIEAEVIRAQGVVRIHLGDTVTSTELADAAFGGQLASGAYVVRDASRALYVDVHLKAAALAAVQVLESPARVVVDLKPGGSAVPAPAATSTRVVLLTPRGGTASYPLQVRGYARTFEANVVMQLQQGGQVAFEDFTTTTDWAETWGEFSFTVASGPTGAVTLFAGEFSARDGTPEGVTLPLQIN